MQNPLHFDSPISSARTCQTEFANDNRISDKPNYSRFIYALRRAFETADVEKKGGLTQEQWNTSNIRKYIQNGNISQEKFAQYFQKIDANCDGVVNWDELVSFLIREISSTDLHLDNESIQYIQKSLTPTPPRSNMHRDMTLRLIVSYRTQEFISLSPDSIRFWNPADLALKRCIVEPGNFADCCIFENQLVIAVVTSNRSLIFYDLDSIHQLSVHLAASPTSADIKQMSIKEAKQALKALESKDMPLFDIPTVMVAGKSRTSQMLFFIGDDQGSIQAFHLTAPLRRAGDEYIIERIGKHKVHSNHVTEILYLGSMYCYASSSMDGTVRFWNFDETNHSFFVFKTFTDTAPIVNFSFSEKQKVLVTCGISRDAYVWSVSPPSKIFKLGGHYNQVIKTAEYVATTGERYIITMTNRKEFRLWDSVNYRLIREWSDPTLQRPENSFTTLLFDYKRHVILTASSCLSKWAEDFELSMDRADIITNSHQIVGCLYSPLFNQIITVDAMRNFKVWDIQTGKRMSQRKEMKFEEKNRISCCAIDASYRRLLSASIDNTLVLWNFSSGAILNETPNFKPAALTSILEFVTIGNRTFLARGGWDHNIHLYIEIEKGQFNLYRSFVGHTNDISGIACHQTGLISTSVDGEIISWILDTNSPQEQLYLSAGIECIKISNNLVFIGDSNGCITVLQLPRLNVVASDLSHGLSVKSLITDISIYGNILVTSDSLGYVKKWTFNESPFSINPGPIFRCHYDDITAIHIVEDGKFVVTCASDNCARMWTINFEYVGLFHDEGDWRLDNTNTYVYGQPAEVDANHFQQSTATKRKQVPLERSLRKFNTILKEQSVMSVKPTDSVVERPMSVMEIGQVIDEFVVSESNKPAFVPVEMKQKEEPVLITEPRQLETGSRPNDLYDRIRGLIEPKQPVTVMQSCNYQIVRPNRSAPKKFLKKVEAFRVPLTMSIK